MPFLVYPAIGFMGRGANSDGQGVPLDNPVPFQEVIRTAEAIAVDCGGSWGQTLKRIVENAKEEVSLQDVATSSQELTEAKAEIARLQKKTEVLLTRTVEL